MKWGLTSCDISWDTVQGHTGAARAQHKIFYSYVSRDCQLSFSKSMSCEDSSSGAVRCHLQLSFFLLACSDFDVWISIEFYSEYSKDWYWITFMLLECSKLRNRLWPDKFERTSLSDCFEGDLCISFWFYTNKSNRLVLNCIVFVRAQQIKNQTMTGRVWGKIH